MRVPRVVRRCLAVGAGTSALLHLLMLGHGTFWSSMLMAGLAVVCLPCAGHLWRVPSRRTAATIGVMNAGMLLLHIWLLLEPGSMIAPEAVGQGSHRHHAGLGVMIDHTALLVAATALAALEVCGASWMLAARSNAIPGSSSGNGALSCGVKQGSPGDRQPGPTPLRRMGA